jgi:AraC-like DNA-binding protein
MASIYQKKQIARMYVSVLEPDAPDAVSGNDFIDIFVSLLRRHGHRPALFYAKKTGIPPDLFTAAVQALTGEYAVECIRQYTDLATCELLRETQLSIGKIAAKMGFDSISAFSQFFSRTHRCSPSEWRWQEAEKQLHASKDDENESLNR